MKNYGTSSCWQSPWCDEDCCRCQQWEEAVEKGEIEPTEKKKGQGKMMIDPIEFEGLRYNDKKRIDWWAVLSIVVVIVGIIIFIYEFILPHIWHS